VLYGTPTETEPGTPCFQFLLLTLAACVASAQPCHCSGIAAAMAGLLRRRMSLGRLYRCASHCADKAARPGPGRPRGASTGTHAANHSRSLTSSLPSSLTSSARNVFGAAHPPPPPSVTATVVDEAAGADAVAGPAAIRTPPPTRARPRRCRPGRTGTTAGTTVGAVATAGAAAAAAAAAAAHRTNGGGGSPRHATGSPAPYAPSAPGGARWMSSGGWNRAVDKGAEGPTYESKGVAVEK